MASPADEHWLHSESEQPRKCVRCGFTSTEDDAFQESRRFVLVGGADYCLKCWARRQNTATLTGYLGSLLIVPWLAVVMLNTLSPTMGFAPVVYLYYPLFGAVSIVFHELGHAFYAYLLGFRVFGITIGHGRTVHTTSIGSLRLEVNAIPTSGVAWVGQSDLAWPRVKRFVVFLAGPLVTACLAVFFWLAFVSLGYDATWGKIGLVCGLANLVILAFSLFPRRSMTPVGIVCSDGLALLTIPFANEAEVRTWHAGYFKGEGDEHFRQEQYEAALQWYRRGLESYPDNPDLRHCVGFALYLLKRLTEARQEMLAILSVTTLGVPQ
jgi:hypothetical protein